MVMTRTANRAMLSRMWSTPERHNGQKMLPIVANEIYLAVMSYIRPEQYDTELEYKKDVFSIALVCHFFYSMAYPRMCESMQIYSEQCDNKDSKWEWLIGIFKETEPGLSNGSYIKHFFVGKHKLTGGHPSRPRAMFLQRCIMALSRMPNLTQLTFHNLAITDNELSAVSAAANLESLSIIECTIFDQFGLVNSGTTNHLPTTLHLPKLTKFRAINTVFLVAPADTRISLHNLSAVEVYVMSPAPAIRSFHEFIVFPRLKILEVTDESFAAKFLRSLSTPTVEELSFTASSYFYRDMHGPDYLYQAAGIADGLTIADVLQQYSSVKKLSFCPFHAQTIYTRPVGSILGTAPLPQLQYLTYNSTFADGHCPIIPCPDAVNRVISEIAYNRHVARSLRGINIMFQASRPEYWPVQLYGQHRRILSDISNKCPNVTIITLGMIEWQRHEQSTEWHPRITEEGAHTISSVQRFPEFYAFGLGGYLNDFMTIAGTSVDVL